MKGVFVKRIPVGSLNLPIVEIIAEIGISPTICIFLKNLPDDTGLHIINHISLFRINSISQREWPSKIKGLFSFNFGTLPNFLGQFGRIVFGNSHLYMPLHSSSRGILCVLGC